MRQRAGSRPAEQSAPTSQLRGAPTRRTCDTDRPARARAPALAPTRRAAATTQVGAPDAPPPLSGPQAAPHTQPFGPAGETSHTVDPAHEAAGAALQGRPMTRQQRRAVAAGAWPAKRASTGRGRSVSGSLIHTRRACVCPAPVYTCARLPAPHSWLPPARRPPRPGDTPASSAALLLFTRHTVGGSSGRSSPRALRSLFSIGAISAPGWLGTAAARPAWCGPRVVRFARGARHGARARCGEICAWSRLHAAAAWLPSAPPCELRSSATPPFRLLAHRCMQNFAPEFTSQLQGWPSGLRRCVQVAVFS